MMKAKKGYSMIVLVIAITVILILATSAISMLQISREKTDITNFIFDITTLEEEVQDYYTRTGTLPTETLEKVDMNDLNNSAPGILSQLDPYDNSNYYYIDLAQLGTITLRNSERGYIVNEGSLKVYVTDGVEYENFNQDNDDSTDDEKITYYTLTSNLVKGLEQYVSQEEEIVVVGNPITWSVEGKLRLVLPRQSLEQAGDEESWKDWKFKWDFGPKTKEELAAIPDTNTAKNFSYGDTLLVKSNGIYSIYVENPNGEVTVINVNVNKIDDRKPEYRFATDLGETRLETSDNETGIKRIRYKTYADFLNNVDQALLDDPDNLEGRTEIDYYLLDGEGKDLIYNFPAEIEDFVKTKVYLEEALEDEYDRYNSWLSENDLSLLTPAEKERERQKHEDYTKDLNNQLSELSDKYPYFLDLYGNTEESQLVIYVEDFSGNATIVGIERYEELSTYLIGKSFNISLESLYRFDVDL